MIKHATIIAAIAALSFPTITTTAQATGSPAPPTMTARGAYDSGAGEGGSEIVAFDTARRRMLVTNGALNRIDIVDIRNVDAPGLVGSVDLQPYGSSVQSVASGPVWAAAAVSGADPTDNGTVVLFDRRGRVRRTYEVGNLPDSLVFSDDGRYIVVANEGEPICDGSSLLVDPDGSVSIIDLWRNKVATAGFDRWNGHEDDLRSDGVRIYFPGSSASQDLEPEYVSIIDRRTAVVTLQENNAIATIDLRSAEVTSIEALGYKDHALPGNGFDPSNEDGAEAIANYDVLGMYLPDTIATARIGRSTYLVTANEGDSRDYDCYSEEERIGDLGLGAAYHDSLEDDALLGRLKTTTAFPTTFDSEGQIEQAYSYGARSFSIWNKRGTLVFDSGDDIEQHLIGTPYFNLDEDETDGRSDDKGPEPEALAVGRIGRKTYAFIGLERSGGIMMFDISRPAHSTFAGYLNTQDLGDVAPEAIVFVPAAKSPTRRPLLLVSFEVSGTTRIIELD
jgi:hypothetical protein